MSFAHIKAGPSKPPPNEHPEPQYQHAAAPTSQHAAATATTPNFTTTPVVDQANNHPNLGPNDLRHRCDNYKSNYMGLLCFGPRIRAVEYPVGFRLDKTFKTYDGSEKPSTWLQDYYEAVRVARADPDVAVRYLPLML